MHVPPPPAQRCAAFAPVLALVLHAVLGAGAARAAQPVIEAPSISSRTERLLAQADALLEDGQWEDALETITLVMDDSDGQLVRVDGGRYVRLRDACQARLTRMPPELLAEHRRRIDPAADRLLEEGRRDRDVAPLQRVIDEYFVSSSTPAAALLLSDLAIERGDFNAARAALARLHPLLTDPAGRPIGIALNGVDLPSHWEQIDPLLREPRQTLPPTYPDAEAELPAALARLALISTLELDLDRARAEAALLRQAAPEATGLLAGQTGPFVDRLAMLIEAADQWPRGAMPAGAPTFAGDATRSGAAAPLGELAGPIWPEPHTLTPVTLPGEVATRRNEVVIVGGRRVIRTVEPEVSQDPQALPVVFGPWVLVRDAGALSALQLRDGAAGVTKDGLLYQAAVGGGAVYQMQDMRVLNLMRARGLAGALVTPLGPLEVSRGVLYARVGRNQPRRTGRVVRTAADPRVLGFGLLSEGLQVVEFEEPEEPWRFSGPPLIGGGLAFIALDANEVRPRVAVACYSVATGKQVWITPVCSGAPAEDAVGVRPADVLTKQGDAIYFNTNMGAIAALDARSGRLDWLAEYPRHELGESPHRADAALLVSPCIAHCGRLLVAPVDCPYVLAIDQASGRGLWSAELVDRRAELLGVRGQTLVAAGGLLTGLDTNTGARRYQWPSSDRSGIRGMGRGCLAGGEVFWPTRSAIYARDAETGAATRTPIDLSPIGAAGANLTPAHGLLVAAGREKMTVYGPQPAPPPDPPKQFSAVTPAAGAASDAND
ncbi:hypothetical protein KOR34_34000 [Posidoniimonas corsicana]|uniref:Pyrrolo-quinoline quinone repeat domain-containing protein n=1 Tax=Posidoniimonas corsicana TaxID=1938618 RepID=A0A5C5V4V8_9BACT|nr:PQQ-binding-like beta-propeller repeat protein [Posidoniimonas corsicana]TWT33568.1 hypothetical protein KOR34_34000 [Posidoniimonas corsicana]